MNADFELYGERVLVETKEERELQAKLKRIEEQLAAFHLPEEIQVSLTQYAAWYMIHPR